MWLDFGVFGPIFWAMLFGFQMSIVQRVFGVTIVTRQAAAAFALVTFVVALPLNTGSYDFTFSVDIFVLLLAVLLTFKLVRVRIANIDPGAITRIAGAPRRARYAVSEPVAAPVKASGNLPHPIGHSSAGATSLPIAAFPEERETAFARLSRRRAFACARRSRYHRVSETAQRFR